ncbi:alkaline phosphatase [Tepiditoga spiralis]|uniref:Alkaline phosphatase n=1 Tax=Tepiditoga spiralis TaxID=2108365 RepID=A0A7G1G5S4_9BACT|nr:alkaline phosphatase [Tepiditoga spiralis]BBE31950.1 alkaline phosphatase [Tepiditoga spiralis]
MKKIPILLLILFLYSNVFSYKYIFLFIADGLGTNHINLANIYSEYKYKKTLNMEKLNNLSLMTSYNKVMDTSAVMTSIMSFNQTNNGNINIDYNGNNIFPITYYLKDSGYKIALITTKKLTSASPASAYAHSTFNNNKNISNQLLNSNIDLLIGGGRVDLPNSINNFEYKLHIPNTPSLKPELIVTSYSDMPYFIDKRKSMNVMLNYALKKFNNNKFFILIDSSKIANASIAHDTYAMINELIDFDNSISSAIEFSKKHIKDTLIIVCGSHEAGGLSLGDGFINIKNIDIQKYSYEKIYKIMKDSKNFYEFSKKFSFPIDLKKEYDLSKNSTTYLNPLTKKVLNYVNKISGIKWSTYGYTVNYVPVFSNYNYKNIIKSTELLWILYSF